MLQRGWARQHVYAAVAADGVSDQFLLWFPPPLWGGLGRGGFGVYQGSPTPAGREPEVSIQVGEHEVDFRYGSPAS